MTITVSDEDVLIGLKRFKRLAEFDIHASKFTSFPSYWQTQATTRVAVYENLIEQVKKKGVGYAYRYAKKRHADLPLLFPNHSVDDGEYSGTAQALEVFLTLIGSPVNYPKRRETNKTVSEGKSMINAQI